MDPVQAVAVNRTFHDHECAYYDKRFAVEHGWRAARRACGEVERLLGRPLQAGEVVLDPGCGTGWHAAGLSVAVPGLRVIGVDVSGGMLSRARAAGGWPLLQADAGRLPLADASVDLIVTRGVLHHLPEVTAALAEWRRVLRPGGAVVVVAEPTPAVEQHGAVLVRALLPVLHRPLTAEEDFWEVAAMAANLHVFSSNSLARSARAAGFDEPRLGTAEFLGTLLLTASYVVHGRRPALARWLPWAALAAVLGWLDRLVLDRVLPARLRHTVSGVLR